MNPPVGILAGSGCADYATNREYSDQFIPEIKRILGPLILDEAEPEVDMKQATDLVLKTNAKAIACRVRRSKAMLSYPWDFTLRATTKWGSKTEFTKILVDGFGDWMFYGFAALDKKAHRFARHFVIDLHALRQWARSDPNREFDTIPAPGGNSFVAFDVRRLPENVIVASSHEVPRAGKRSQVEFKFSERDALLFEELQRHARQDGSYWVDRSATNPKH